MICVGCGLDVNVDGILEVQLRPGGGISCDDSGDANDGLYITGTGVVGIVADDSGTIDFSGDGSSGSHLTAAVKKSTDNCNALINGSDGGLYVACQDGVGGTSAVQLSPQGSGLPQLLDTDGANYDYLNDNAFNSINICNPTCCAVNGYLIVSVGDAFLDVPPGAIVKALLQINVDNGGFADMSPLPIQILSADSGNAQNSFMYVYMNATYFLNIGANSCHQIQWRLRFSVQEAAAGTGHIRTDSTGPKFVTRWVFTHTDCCDHA